METIQKIALPSLAELAASLVFGAICCAYTAPASVSLIIGTVAFQWVINTVIRAVSTYFKYREKTDWITSYNFAKGSLRNVQALIHEQGHVMAANALIKNANPSIQLLPYTGAVTKFTLGKATDLGQKIGTKNIHPVIAAAGPALTLAVSTGALATGLALREKYPELAKVLIVASVLDFLTHAIYAVSALFTSPTNFAHDFVVLWQLGGVHPVAAMVAVVALPILILTRQNWLEKGSELQQQNRQSGRPPKLH